MDVLTDIDLVRAVAPRSLLRADAEEDGYLGTLDIRFSPFNTWYEIDSFFEGQFLERTAKGAFSKTMKESREAIKALFDHGMDFHIGNKVLGPIREMGEDESAFGVVPLLDTSYNRDLLPGLREGLYGSSFRFRVVKEEWNDEPGVSSHNSRGLPERTIKEVRLFEFGPVTFPANPAATAGMRSMTDEFYERLRARNPEHYEELRARAQSLRTPDDAAARTGTADEGAANPADEPASSHSERMSQEQLETELRRRDLRARGVLQ